MPGIWGMWAPYIPQPTMGWALLPLWPRHLLPLLSWFYFLPEAFSKDSRFLYIYLTSWVLTGSLGFNLTASHNALSRPDSILFSLQCLSLKSEWKVLLTNSCILHGCRTNITWPTLCPTLSSSSSHASFGHNYSSLWVPGWLNIAR